MEHHSAASFEMRDGGAAGEFVEVAHVVLVGAGSGHSLLLPHFEVNKALLGLLGD